MLDQGAGYCIKLLRPRYGYYRRTGGTATEVPNPNINCVMCGGGTVDEDDTGVLDPCDGFITIYSIDDDITLPDENYVLSIVNSGVGTECPSAVSANCLQEIDLQYEGKGFGKQYWYVGPKTWEETDYGCSAAIINATDNEIVQDLTDNDILGGQDKDYWAAYQDPLIRDS